MQRRLALGVPRPNPAVPSKCDSPGQPTASSQAHGTNPTNNSEETIMVGMCSIVQSTCPPLQCNDNAANKPCRWYAVPNCIRKRINAIGAHRHACSSACIACMPITCFDAFQAVGKVQLLSNSRFIVSCPKHALNMPPSMHKNHYTNAIVAHGTIHSQTLAYLCWPKQTHHAKDRISNVSFYYSFAHAEQPAGIDKNMKEGAGRLAVT